MLVYWNIRYTFITLLSYTYGSPPTHCVPLILIEWTWIYARTRHIRSNIFTQKLSTYQRWISTNLFTISLLVCIFPFRVLVFSSLGHYIYLSTPIFTPLSTVANIQKLPMKKRATTFQYTCWHDGPSPIVKGKRCRDSHKNVHIFGGVAKNGHDFSSPFGYCLLLLYIYTCFSRLF